MKVLLIQPPFIEFKRNVKRCHPPLGLAYLVAMTKDRHEVKILDAIAEGFDEEEIIDRDNIRYGLGFKEIAKRISNFKPDLVGISCPLTTQSETVYKLCSAVKELDENIITVIGGAHPSVMPEEALSLKDIDYVVLGEGEVTFRNLLECLEKGKEPRDLDGLGYKRDGNILVNVKKNYIKDLDKIPFPEWSFFPLERYFSVARPHGTYPEMKRFLPIFSSRGCPNNCIFCSIHTLWGRPYRKRSAENVLGEMEYLIEKYGVQEIYFEDDNLTLDRKRSFDIFRGMADRKFNVKWSSPNGVFIGTIDDEILDLMKKSGCRALSFGIESGDKHMLNDIIDKHIDLGGVAPVIRKAKALKIETSVFFVLGVLGETKESLRNTLSYAWKLPADYVLFFFATPLPGTRLCEACKRKGMVFDKRDYKNLRSENALLIPEGMSKKEFLRRIEMAKNWAYLRKAFKSPGWLVSKLKEKYLG